MRKLYSNHCLPVTSSPLLLSIMHCLSSGAGMRGNLTDIPKLEQAPFQPDSKPRHMGEELLCSGQGLRPK